MFLVKRFSILLIMAAVLVSILPAQTGRQLTPEESYLMDTMEVMIITQTARMSTRDQKLLALDYIGEAIERGNTNDEIRLTLEYLASEGRRTVARESGRLVNNFPDVRRRAARYLGVIGTEEARQSLIQIILYENEPMVIQEAIKSLGDIGVNVNNDTVEAIAWVVTRFDNLNPDNMMALATIDAFEKIAKSNNGLQSTAAIEMLLRISTGYYMTPVRERARQLLLELRTY
ncbi:MAG: HEAT repeat domain-containing protein [Treponema sp.]|nr:HEAT repeat domain-containing protein [Treponema sp.]